MSNDETHQLLTINTNKKAERRKLMSKKIDSLWNFFLVLDDDMNNTSRYVDPIGNENVWSFEFLKVLLLSCTESESIFKLMCRKIDSSNSCGNIGDYKRIILGAFPKIVNATVTVKRLEREIKPFEGWDVGPLQWWDAYQLVKHNRDGNFQKATYMNAITVLSALYILILYLSKIDGEQIESSDVKCINSPYMIRYLVCEPNKNLPGFEVTP